MRTSLAAARRAAKAKAQSHSTRVFTGVAGSAILRLARSMTSVSKSTRSMVALGVIQTFPVEYRPGGAHRSRAGERAPLNANAALDGAAFRLGNVACENSREFGVGNDPPARTNLYCLD